MYISLQKYIYMFIYICMLVIIFLVVRFPYLRYFRHSRARLCLGSPDVQCHVDIQLDHGDPKPQPLKTQTQKLYTESPKPQNTIKTLYGTLTKHFLEALRL